MNINDAFPSKYLKASDLKNRTVNVVIENVAIERLGNDNKVVVYFEGKDKGLVLNKTNANMIAEITEQQEMDNWIGHKIAVYPTHVDFQGKRTPAIRVEYPVNGGTLAGQPPPPPPPPVDDDDIPF